ncbi:MAG TPA: hypothetical protein VF406_00015 [Thermodesulfobacteriota bacterium]
MTHPTRTPARLRHGLTAVPIHLIAEQLYCERKVDLALDFPEVERPTAEIEAGTAGHAALAAAAEPIAPADLDALVGAGEAVRLHEYRFRGDVDGVPIVGRPDAVFLRGRAADLVLEFKFSAWRRPFPSHRLQLLAYGFLLGQGGYDVSRLVCGVLMLPPGARPAALAEADYAVCAAHASHLAARRRPGGPDVTAAPEAVAGGTLSLFPYDAAEAARRLGWAVAFWKGRRPARLADNPSKCRRCVFMEVKLCGGTRTR